MAIEPALDANTLPITKAEEAPIEIEVVDPITSPSWEMMGE